MKLHIKNDVHYYTFTPFDRTGLVRHCFTTRIGGVSEGCYESLNLGFSNGDQRAHVQENYERLCQAVGFEQDHLVFSNQRHGTNIYVADESDRGKGILLESDIHDADCLITTRPNVTLTTFSADCVPLFFLDRVKKIIALAHAGWRGTLNGIGRLTVNHMLSLGSSPQDILVGIGPSIGGCCFEVDPPVAEAFQDGLPFSSQFMSRWEDRPGKYFIDLWSINAEILIRAGIPAENIELSGLCTRCNTSIFYSHRVMGTQRGTMAALMELI